MNGLDGALRVIAAVAVVTMAIWRLGQDNTVVPRVRAERVERIRTGDLILVSVSSMFLGMVESPVTHVGLAVRNGDGRVRMFHCNSRHGAHTSPLPARLTYVRRLYPPLTISDEEAAARLAPLCGRAYSATYSPIIAPLVCPWFPLPFEPSITARDGLTCISAVMSALELLGVHTRTEADASVNFGDLAEGVLTLEAGFAFAPMQQLL